MSVIQVRQAIVPLRLTGKDFIPPTTIHRVSACTVGMGNIFIKEIPARRAEGFIIGTENIFTKATTILQVREPLHSTGGISIKVTALRQAEYCSRLIRKYLFLSFWLRLYRHSSEKFSGLLSFCQPKC